MADELKDHSLERALKTPEAHIDNQDFSRRVLGVLPKKRRFTLMRRRFVIAGSALGGLVLSYTFMPPWENLPVINVVMGNVWYMTVVMIAFAVGVASGAWWLVSARICGSMNSRHFSRLVHTRSLSR